MDQNGLVTAVGPGTATITARAASGVADTLQFEVAPLVIPVTRLALSGKTRIPVGQTSHLTATLYPADATETDLVWSSTHEGIARVDQNGLVTAVGPGTATITAQAPSGASGSVRFTVYVDAGTSGGTDGVDDPPEDTEQAFWERVSCAVQEAASGDTVQVDAGIFDRMPRAVMEALKNAQGVTLSVTWDGGEGFSIPSAAALTPEASRIYYPLSYLAGLDFTVSVDPDALNPGTGGVWIVGAPAVQAPSSGQPQVAPSDQGLAGVAQPAPSVPGPAPAAAAQPQPALAGHGWPWAVAAALAALLAGGLVVWRQKKRKGASRG